MQGIQIQSLGGKDPLEEGIATHSNILAWRIPGKRDPVLLDRGAWWATVIGITKSQTDSRFKSECEKATYYMIPMA